MKRLLAILLILVLSWAQGTTIARALVPPLPARHAACACRACCAGACCCVSRPASDPQPFTPAAVPNTLEIQQLLFAPVQGEAIAIPQTSSIGLSFPPSWVSRPAAVALYQQHCAFLI